MERLATHNSTNVSANPFRKKYAKPASSSAFIPPSTLIVLTANAKSTSQRVVLTSCRMRYVNGWSLVAAYSTISVMEVTVLRALLMRMTLLVLFGDFVSESWCGIGGEEVEGITYVRNTVQAGKNTRMEIRTSMKTIWKAQNGMRTFLSHGLLLWNL